MAIIFAIQLGIYAAVLGALIYLAIKRVQEKKSETFEKRDN